MKLSSRFLLDSLFVVAGAFLTVASMAWAAGTAGWTAFGVSVGITVLAAASAVLAKKREGSVRGPSAGALLASTRDREGITQRRAQGIGQWRKLCKKPIIVISPRSTLINCGRVSMRV